MRKSDAAIRYITLSRFHNATKLTLREGSRTPGRSLPNRSGNGRTEPNICYSGQWIFMIALNNRVSDRSAKQAFCYCYQHQWYCLNCSFLGNECQLKVELAIKTFLIFDEILEIIMSLLFISLSRKLINM